ATQGGGTEMAGHFVYGEDPNWTAERNAHKVTFATSPQWRPLFKAWLELKSHCFDPGAAGTSQAHGQPPFANGKSGMSIGPDNQDAVFRRINPNINLAWVNLPGDNLKERGMQLSISLNLGIPKGVSADETNLAKTFINFLMRPKQNALWNK